MPVHRAPADFTHLQASMGNEITEPSLAAFLWIPLRRRSFLKSGTASLINDGLHVIPATLRNELVPRDDQRDMTTHITLWEWHVFMEKRRPLVKQTFRLSIAPQALKHTWNHIQLPSQLTHVWRSCSRARGLLPVRGNNEWISPVIQLKKYI